MIARAVGLAVAVALSLSCAGPRGGPAADRSSEPRPGPGVRNAHGLAYDGQRVVLIGGATERAVVGDTWGWDGRRWTHLATDGPPPRTFPAVAGDADGHRVYLFGGSTVLFGSNPGLAQMLDDFWIWDGRQWTPWTGPRPPARAEAAAAWDAARARFVVFGGYTFVDGERRRLGDTWEFDGTTWRQVAADGPAPRNGAAMAYDGVEQRVLLFGGSGRRDDTWRWDGRRWETVATGSVPPRYNASIAWDGAARRVLRFGGWDGETRTADSWTWANGTWTELNTSGPSARNHSGLAFDAGRRCAVLVGGHDGDHVMGDVWEHCGTAWRNAWPAASLRRVDNGHE